MISDMQCDHDLIHLYRVKLYLQHQDSLKVTTPSTSCSKHKTDRLTKQLSFNETSSSTNVTSESNTLCLLQLWTTRTLRARMCNAWPSSKTISPIDAPDEQVNMCEALDTIAADCSSLCSVQTAGWPNMPPLNVKTYQYRTALPTAYGLNHPSHHKQLLTMRWFYPCAQRNWKTLWRTLWSLAARYKSKRALNQPPST